MKKFFLLSYFSFLSFPFTLLCVAMAISDVSYSQVAINKDGSAPTDTSAMLEIKKGIKSKLKIRSLNYNDTVVLEMSNRNTSNEGTDFIISSNRENGLRISTQSDLPGNVHNGIMHLTPQGMVGINNTVPVERLDIDGNINLTGTIKTNGVDGQPNQVLMKNNNGNLAWGDLCDLKNYVSFTFNSGTSTWIVPANVTKIAIEAWGAGGGGSCFSGGGGGGYIRAYFTVTAGSTVTFSISNTDGGVNCAASAAHSGSTTTVTVNGITVRAHGGSGGYTSAGLVYLGQGGEFDVIPNTFRNWFGVAGEDGHASQINYMQAGSSTFYELIQFGKGGNAGNTTNTGGGSGYTLYNLSTTTLTTTLFTGTAKMPGGGGSGGSSRLGFGANANTGMVTIHY